MSKRFTDTGKWDKTWIQELLPNHKLFWVYLIDKCDHAGLWEVNVKLAEFQLGIKLDLNELLKVYGDKIQVVNGGSKWFLPGFIDFQYGELNPSNRVHVSVLSLLKRYKIQAPCKPLVFLQKSVLSKETLM